MGEIATSEPQITQYCHSQSVRAKKTLTYAKAEGLTILQIDILKIPLISTQITELADRLGIEIKKLVNQDHPSFGRKFDHHNFSSEDWIKMIKKSRDHETAYRN